jgi:hypothetical protein
MGGLAQNGVVLSGNAVIRGQAVAGIAAQGSVVWQREEVPEPPRTLGSWTATTGAPGNLYTVGYSAAAPIPFVAAGLNTGATSPDGMTWTTRSVSTTIRAIAYGNGVWVVAGDSDTKWSSDGTAWTNVAGIGTGVAFGNGLFVRVATNAVATSTNGATWTQGTISNGTWGSITFANGLFVAAANTGTPAIATSPDGINWTARASAPAAPTGYAQQGPAFGNGIWVVPSRGTANVITSPDGVTWTQQTGALPANTDWFNCAFGAGLFIATGRNTGATALSTDGINWTAGPSRAVQDWRGLTFGNDLFVQTGVTATNTITWS